MNIEKIGEGSYSKVFLLKNNNTIYALKINIINTELNGMGNSSIKEIDILTKLKGHPYIIDLIEIEYGFPTDLSILKTKVEKHHIYDSVKLKLEYIPSTLLDFLKNREICNFDMAKSISVQLCLAIEYMHSKNITHRDLKPSNILIKNENNDYTIKIIDFGMSQILNKNTTSSSEVTSSWYRAPEICCCYENYTKKIDIWSYGCIVYELFVGLPLIIVEKDININILKKIFEKLPNIKSNLDFIKTLNNKIIIKTAKMVINTNKFIETKIKCELFNNLLLNILNVNFYNRYTATEILNDNFFLNYKNYITDFRKQYPPIANELDIVKIIDCIEHKWIMDLAVILYNSKSSYPWYSNRILLHTIDLLDLYLEKKYTPNNFINSVETDKTGKLHSVEHITLLFNIFIYLVYKYYNVINYNISFKEFIGNKNIDFTNKIILDIEMEILKLSNYTPIRDCLFEIHSQFIDKIDNKSIELLLYKYSSVIEWKDGTYRSLFKHLYEIKE